MAAPGGEDITCKCTDVGGGKSITGGWSKTGAGEASGGACPVTVIRVIRKTTVSATARSAMKKMPSSGLTNGDPP